MSNTRPYYNPATFRSPIKGYDELGLVSVGGDKQVSNVTHTISHGGASSSSSSGSLPGSSAFVYLDVNLGDTSDTITGTAQSMVRLYSRVFASQPWEVTRLLLQVGDWDSRGAGSTKSTSSSHNGGRNVHQLSDEEADEEFDYFTAVTGENLRSKRARRSVTERQHHEQESADEDGEQVVARIRDENYPNLLETDGSKAMDVVHALYSKDYLRGWWRALNTSFIIDALGSTVEAWLSGFLSSVSGVPDPHFVEVLHSPNPLVSLGAAVAASVITAVALAPIDMIRTRLVVTAVDSSYPRSIRTSLRNQDSFFAPWSVIVPTVLHSGIVTFIKRSTPYLLYTKLGIDGYNSPSLFNFFILFSNLFEVGVKLPLETMLKRSHVDALDLSNDALIVRPKQYRGVIGTFWSVLTREEKFVSLFQGWQVTLCGAFAEWGMKATQNIDQQQERF